MQTFNQILSIIFIGMMIFPIVLVFAYSTIFTNQHTNKQIIVQTNTIPLVDIATTSLFSLGLFIGTTVFNSSHIIDNIIVTGAMWLIIFGLLIGCQKIIRK